MSVVSGQNSETEDTGESHIGHITLDISHWTYTYPFAISVKNMCT